MSGEGPPERPRLEASISLQKDNPVPKLRVNSFSISLDGYGAGPDQDLANPLGVGGMGLHQWAFKTRTIRQMFGQEGGSTDTDDAFAARGFDNIGAWILGRKCSAPSAASGRTKHGKAGGETTRPITCRSSC